MESPPVDTLTIHYHIPQLFKISFIGMVISFLILALLYFLNIIPNELSNEATIISIVGFAIGLVSIAIAFPFSTILKADKTYQTLQITKRYIFYKSQKTIRVDEIQGISYFRYPETVHLTYFNTPITERTISTQLILKTGQKIVIDYSNAYARIIIIFKKLLVKELKEKMYDTERLATFLNIPLNKNPLPKEMA